MKKILNNYSMYVRKYEGFNAIMASKNNTVSEIPRAPLS